MKNNKIETFLAKMSCFMPGSLAEIIDESITITYDMEYVTKSKSDKVV